MTLSINGRKGFLLVLGCIWIFCIALGFVALNREEFTPVATAVVPSDFPSGSNLRLESDSCNLLIFVHPYCPCSRATLHELDVLLAQANGNIATTIVFTIPPGLEPGWRESDLWQQAARIRGVKVEEDRNGMEARRFRVTGSGHALLYGASGALLFSGGITASRGHEGDNAGVDAILSLASQKATATIHTPVYGCSLF